MHYPKSKVTAAVVAQVSLLCETSFPGEYASPEDLALAACLVAAIGAWRDGKAREHLRMVRAAVNGEVMPLRKMMPSLN